MNVLRKILGVFVMIAGLIGLVISIAGLAGLWMVRPSLTSSINTTIVTLTDTLDTSLSAMDVTNEALGGAVKSIDALSEMLANTADSVAKTQPVVDEVNGMMGETLPATFDAANDSLRAAEDAATSMEGAIKSFDSFRVVMGAVPMVSAFMPAADKPYSPEKPLAESLGDLAVSLEEMPATFKEISLNLDQADDNLELIKSNLDVMSANVSLISSNIGQYQTMIGDSKASMGNLKTMLVNIQANLERSVNMAAAALALFFLWLLAAQVVIFSQGIELFQGTAGRMEGGTRETVVVTTPDTVSTD